MKWKIIDTGKASAAKNMEIDYALLRDLPTTTQPILHLYDWEGDAATYGHFLDPYKYLKKDVVEKSCLQLARRPTGGGIVFHLTDFAYSILIPACHPGYSVNTLDNYAYIHSMMAKIIHEFLDSAESPTLFQEETTASHPHAPFFCMAKPTMNDVMLHGKKVGGGAQRRTKFGFLHQGTISLGKPNEELLSGLLMKKELTHSFIQNSFYPGRDNGSSVMMERKSLFKQAVLATVSIYTERDSKIGFGAARMPIFESRSV